MAELWHGKGRMWPAGRREQDAAVGVIPVGLIPTRGGGTQRFWCLNLVSLPVPSPRWSASSWDGGCLAGDEAAFFLCTSPVTRGWCSASRLLPRRRSHPSP